MFAAICGGRCLFGSAQHAYQLLTLGYLSGMGHSSPGATGDRYQHTRSMLPSLAEFRLRSTLRQALELDPKAQDADS